MIPAAGQAKPGGPDLLHPSGDALARRDRHAVPWKLIVAGGTGATSDKIPPRRAAELVRNDGDGAVRMGQHRVRD